MIVIVEDFVTGRQKSVEFAVIPRVGELVKVGVGGVYKVEELCHSFADNFGGKHIVIARVSKL